EGGFAVQESVLRGPADAPHESVGHGPLADAGLARRAADRVRECGVRFLSLSLEKRRVAFGQAYPERPRVDRPGQAGVGHEPDEDVVCGGLVTLQESGLTDSEEDIHRIDQETLR